MGAVTAGMESSDSSLRIEVHKRDPWLPTHLRLKSAAAVKQLSAAAAAAVERRPLHS